MSDFESQHKQGNSLVWDENGKLRAQKWPELRRRIEETQGGLGVVADDFREMLEYRSGPFRDKARVLRDAFADLTRDARSPEDLDLLADILAYMLRRPWEANLDGAWFIYYLEEPGSRDIDVVRAAAVINRLHGSHRPAALVLFRTLGNYVYGEDKELVIDLILKTGRLADWVIESIKQIPLPPPAEGGRSLVAHPPLFLSYCRADRELMRSVRSELSTEGFYSWTDESLVPGTPDWPTALEDAIRTSSVVVVVMTPGAKASVWVNREIDVALRLGKRVFPLLAVGCADSAVNAQLARVQRVDIRDDLRNGISLLGEAIRRYRVAPPPGGA
ncbi:MAG: toll/interleukin-1 receptor domain-containing protein [Planctomycetes bacterium]|nr:toll/interleukin-1 receptor domain-containing protein [Planctomycetota bacterium]